MLDHSILLLLLVTAQVAPRTDADRDRARRAAIVDRIMAEPAPPRPLRPALVEAPEEQQARQPVAIEGNRNKQIVLESKEIAPSNPDGEDEDPPPVQFRRPINLNEMALARGNFDHWVFGESMDEESRRSQLRSLLSGKISSLEKKRKMTVEQAEKLRLAGMGDIKRFFDRVQESRNDFEVARKDFKAGRIALNQLEPLSKDYQDGPFGSDSFFAKALRKMESDEKAARQRGR